VLLPADLGLLAAEASTVVRGRVAAVQPRWSDDRRSIERLVTLEVEAYLKGTLGPSVTFRAPGGEIGRYRSVLVGAPDFSVDERVIVFLAHRGPSIPHVLGLSQGVYRIGNADGTAVVTPPPLLLEAQAAGPVVRGDARRRPLPLDAFEGQVRTLVESKR